MDGPHPPPPAPIADQCTQPGDHHLHPSNLATRLRPLALLYYYIYILYIVVLVY